LSLADREDEFQLTGTVDLSRRVNLHVRMLPRSNGPAAGRAEVAAWNVTGTLDTPHVQRQTSVAATPPNAVATGR